MAVLISPSTELTLNNGRTCYKARIYNYDSNIVYEISLVQLYDLSMISYLSNFESPQPYELSIFRIKDNGTTDYTDELYCKRFREINNPDKIIEEAAYDFIAKKKFLLKEKNKL